MNFPKVWFAILILVYMGFGIGLDQFFINHPKLVLVAVDTSFAMKKFENNVETLLLEMGKPSRYVRYGLISDKTMVQDWQPDIKKVSLNYYGPLNLEPVWQGKIKDMVEHADQKIFISNADKSKRMKFRNWNNISVSD